MRYIEKDEKWALFSSPFFLKTRAVKCHMNNEYCIPNRKSSTRRWVSYDIIRLACYFQCLTFYAECIQPTNGKCSRSFLYSSNLTRGSAKRVRETVFICFSSFCRIPITSTYLRGILWESNSITYIHTSYIYLYSLLSKSTYWYWSNVQGM